MDQWLVRTSKNWIAGPFHKEQVCEMIRQGEIDVQDEVCQANSYWFALHETDEVFANLGIQMPRLNGEEDDVTETQAITNSQFHEEKTDPDMELRAGLTDLDVSSEGTAVITPEAIRAAKKKKEKEESSGIAESVDLEVDTSALEEDSAPAKEPENLKEKIAINSTPIEQRSSVMNETKPIIQPTVINHEEQDHRPGPGMNLRNVLLGFLAVGFLIILAVVHFLSQ